MKHMKVFVITGIIFCLLLISSCQSKSPEITIKNGSDSDIKNAKIQYQSNKKTIDIGTIKTNEKITKPISEEKDDSIVLIFTDKEGSNQKIIIAGYITKGSGDISVTVKQDSKGKWISEE